MNIWCVGRNYADHARELGNDVPSEPLIFLKAGSCLSRGREIILPTAEDDIHHELEIALEFGGDLRFSSMALALDLTDRTAQARLKAKGQPWTLAKSFRGACPMSAAVPLKDLTNLRLHLTVNGDLRQAGSTKEMIFDPEALRAFVIKHFPVEPGDWLLTGTPAGVGPLRPGDHLEGTLSDSRGTVLLQSDWDVRRPD